MLHAKLRDALLLDPRQRDKAGLTPVTTTGEYLHAPVCAGVEKLGLERNLGTRLVTYANSPSGSATMRALYLRQNEHVHARSGWSSGRFESRRCR